MDQDTPSSPDKGSSPYEPQVSGLRKFWQELKRRHVVRVGMVYAVVAWLIIQIAARTFEGFGIPDWAFRFVVLMVVLGFPVAVILAWAFELTPQGIKTTKVAQKEIRLLENTARHAEATEDVKAHAKKTRLVFRPLCRCDPDSHLRHLGYLLLLSLWYSSLVPRPTPHAPWTRRVR